MTTILRRWAAALGSARKDSKPEAYLLAFVQQPTDEARRNVALYTGREALVNETWAHLESLEGDARDQFAAQLAALPADNPSQFVQNGHGTFVGNV